MRFERMILAASMASAAMLATPVLAAMDPADAVGVCSRISKKDARLECYDQVARDTASGTIQPRAQAMPAPAGAAAASPQSWNAPPPPQSWSAPPPPGAAPQSQQEQASGFGAQQVKRGRDDSQGPSSIQAEVTASSDNGLGQWKMTLADGAVWQMTERVPLFRPPAPHESVTIRQGALGGFLMDVGKQASVRVMRVR